MKLLDFKLSFGTERKLTKDKTIFESDEEFITKSSIFDCLVISHKGAFASFW